MQLNPIRFMRLSVFKPRVAMSLFNALNDRHLEHSFGHLIDIRGHGLLTLRYWGIVQSREKPLVLRFQR